MSLSLENVFVLTVADGRKRELDSMYYLLCSCKLLLITYTCFDALKLIPQSRSAQSANRIGKQQLNTTWAGPCYVHQRRGEQPRAAPLEGARPPTSEGTYPPLLERLGNMNLVSPDNDCKRRAHVSQVMLRLCRCRHI